MGTSYITEQTPAGDKESLTVSTVAVGFTAAKISINQVGGFHKRAVRAFVTVETNPVRFWYDGSTPTSTVGHHLNSGDSVTIDGEGNVTNFKVIRSSEAAADATLMITYFYNA